MPIPLLVPPQEDSRLQEEKPNLRLVNNAASWQSAGLIPRALAHGMDWCIVWGFSLYFSKILSLALIKFHVGEIQQSGKFAGKLFSDTLAYGESQVKIATLLFFSFIYFVGLPLWRGKTLGLGMFGLKIENESGGTPGWKSLSLRFLGCLLIYASAGALLIQWFRGKDRPIVHDFLSGTKVVKH